MRTRRVRRPQRETKAVAISAAAEELPRAEDVTEEPSPAEDPTEVLPRAGDATTLPDPRRDPSRRRFLQVMAAATAAPWTRVALPSLGLAAVASTAAAQTPTEETPAEVAPWLEILKQRYGKHWTPEQLQAVQENLGWTARAGKALRAAALTNADEPNVVFRAQPPEAAR